MDPTGSGRRGSVGSTGATMRLPDFGKGLRFLLGAFLLVAGTFGTLFQVALQTGHSIVLSSSAGGKVGGRYESIQGWTTTVRDLAPGSVKGAQAIEEKRTSRFTERRGSSPSITYDVTLLSVRTDVDTIIFEVPHARELADRINALPSAAPGQEVRVEAPVPWFLILCVPVAMVIGGLGVLYLVLRRAPPSGPAAGQPGGGPNAPAAASRS